MNKIIEYVKSAFDELMYKVTWPTWKELQSSAVVVLIATFISGLIVAAMDYAVGFHGTPTSFFRGLAYHIYDALI